MTATPVRPRLGRDFAALWAANSMANLGDAMYWIALPLLALGLGASPAQVAAVTVLLTAAWPIFGLPAGLIADRLDRRTLVVAVNAGRTAVLGVLSVLMLTGTATIGAIYGAAFLLGVGETLVDSSLAALVPATVRDDGLLGRANARLEVAQTVTNQFVGPPLAGLLAAAGLAWVTGSGAALYLVTIPLLWAMRGRYRVGRPAVRERFVPAVTAGLRFLWHHRLLRSLTLITTAMNVFWSAWLATLVVYAVAPGPVGLNPAGYGLLLTAMAVGGVAGAALVEPLRRRLGDRRVLALDVVGTILLIGTPAITADPLAIGAAMLVGGAGSAVWRVICAVLRQRLTPADLLGRVSSASRAISWGVLPFGAALGGALAELWGIRAVFVVGGLASLGLLVLFGFTVRPADLAAATTPAPASGPHQPAAVPDAVAR